jgi:hypothetical protein
VERRAEEWPGVAEWAVPTFTAHRSLLTSSGGADGYTSNRWLPSKKNVAIILIAVIILNEWN